MSVGVLLLALLTLFPFTADAQRPTWPSDAAGRPAPPCTTWDTATNAVTPCSATTPLIVSTVPSTSGTSAPTGSANDPTGWGRSLFESLQAFDSRTSIGGASWRWDDQNTVTVLRRTAATTIQVWRSFNRGQTYTMVNSFAGGFANMGTMGGSLVYSTASGRYITNFIGGGVGGAAFGTSPDLVNWTAATGTAVVPGGATSFTGGSVQLSPNTAGRLIGIRVNGTAATCSTVLSINSGASYTLTGTELACAGAVPGELQYVGGTTWIWVKTNGAVIRSTDDGATWAATTSVAAVAGPALCVPPATGSGLGYCLVSTGAAGAQIIFRSTNAGTTWTQVINATGQVNIFLSFTDYGGGILGLITDQVATLVSLWKSNDAGFTWSPSASVVYTGGSTPTSYFPGTGLNNRSPGSPSNGAGSAVWIPTGAGAPANPLYSSTIPPGSGLIIGSGGVPWSIDLAGRGVVTPQQAVTLANSQTTGAATTAVVVNLAAGTNFRWAIRTVEARCNTAAATAGLTIESPVATTIWSTVATEVIAASNFFRKWETGLTGATSAAMRITLAACTAGTGTLMVQADQSPVR
jgi:hypothetical protein